MSKHPRPCLACRRKARHGRVCDECRAAANLAAGREIAMVPTTLPAAPFIRWLDRQVQFADGGMHEIARLAGVTESWLRKGAFRRAGTIVREKAEQVLEAHHVYTWEIWDELPEDTAVAA